MRTNGSRSHGRGAAWLLVFIEPADDISHLGHLMTRPDGNTVRLLRDADEHALDAEQLERLVVLLGIRDGRAIVGFAGHYQRWGLYIFHDREERAFFIMLGVIPR